MLCIGNFKTDCHSNMKLLIVLKIPSTFGWSSLQGIYGREHTREQTQDKLEIKHCEFFKQILNSKGPVKLIQWVKIAPLFFICYVKIVPVYNFKLIWVALHLSDK